MLDRTLVRRSLAAYTGLYLGILYLPILLIPIFSFNDSVYVKIPLSGFTTQWYMKLFQSRALLEALGNSLRVAVTVSIASTILGLTAAIALARFQIYGRRAISSFLCAPLIVPHLILGISILMAITYAGIELSLYAVAFGHMLICTPFSLLVIAPRLGEFDQSLTEASRDLGEGAFGTFRRVTLPLIAPAITSSLLLTATLSLDEFVVAFFLSGNRPTLPVFIWSQLRFPDQLPSVLALGTCIIAVSVVMVAISEILGRRASRLNLLGGEH